MPIGLANSPSVFQAFINDSFRDMLNQFVIVYIDDILIYSNTLEEHVQHICAMLQCLIPHQLYAKGEKCEFHQTTISLGYVLSPEGVTMEDNKVRAVLQWPQPILHHADPEKTFIVEVNASNTGIGAILSQCQSTPLKLFFQALLLPNRIMMSRSKNY